MLAVQDRSRYDSVMSCREAMLVALALAACGPTTKPQTTVPNDLLDGKSGSAGAGSATTAPVAAADTTLLTPEDACARFAKLSSDGCAWSERFPPEFHDSAVCARSLATWFAPSTADHERMHRTVSCWAADCDDAAACMVREQSSAPPPAPRACGQEGTAPIVVDDATWAARRGATAKHFGDVHTTEKEPVELCGIESEVEWMTRITCANGSNPIGTQERANEVRDSWMARGGKCNSILDRYSVACPEATYVIHIDRYVCPRKP